jgi:hypothetical protein
MGYNWETTDAGKMWKGTKRRKTYTAAMGEVGLESKIHVSNTKF